MKREKLVTAIWGFFLGFLISFSATACMVTGFDMAVDLRLLALWCGAAALIGCLCFALPLSPLPLSAWAVSGVVLWLKGDLEKSVRALLYRLSREYDRVHGWGVLQMKHYTIGEIEPMLWPALCFLGAAIAIGITWAICRRKTAAPGILLALLCFGACLVSTETVPAGLWLYAILFGLLLVLLTHTVRRESASRGNRLSILAALPLALFLLLLFGLVPQSRYTGQETARAVVNQVLENELVQAVFGDLTTAGNSGSSVSGGTVQLGSVGVRVQSQIEILQLHTDFSGVIYLRGRALDTYDGLSWRDSEESVTALYWPATEEMEPQGEVEVSTRYAHGMLYLPYYVKSMDLNGITRGVENAKKLTQYSFTTVKMPTPSIISGLNSPLPEDASSYVHLTSEVKKWAEPLAREITEGKNTVYDQAKAIGDYVRSSARYDLKTSAMPARKKDFAKWFLQESDTGYCVHFATSAVVLLQAAGIPARYVSGYMTRVGTDCFTTVQEMDAHAWAEYWLPGFGWTVLEATPGEQMQTDETPVPTPSQTKLPFDWKLSGLVAAGTVLVAVIALFVQRTVRLRLRRRKLQSGTVKQRLLAHWREAVLFSRCLGGLPDDRLFALAERAKFSQHAPKEQDLELFYSYLQEARVQMKRHNLLRKLYYRFVLALY